MKWIESYHYDPAEDLIHIPVVVFGPMAKRSVRLIFDPGAYRTIIKTRVTDAIGYQATKESKRISTTSIAGKEYGYTLCIQKLTILGFEFTDIEVASFDLPERYRVDGLIGLDILKKFEVTLRHRDHWIQFRFLEN